MAEEAPRPPFDANSSPPYQCFFPLCWVERPTYLALNDHIKVAHPKVASSDFDGTFFGKAVRQERQVKNRRRFAAPAVEAAAAAGACADGASGAAGAGLEAARRRRGRSSAAAKTGAAGGSGPAAAAEAAAAVLAQRVADPQYVVPRQTGAAAGGRKARKRAPSAAAGGSGPAAAAPAPAAAAAAEAAPPRQVFSDRRNFAARTRQLGVAAPRVFFSVNSEVACDGEEGRERCDTWFALPAGRISSDAFRRKAKGATAASKAKAAGVAGAPTGAALPAGAAGGAAGSHSAGSGSAACAAPPRQTGVVGADAPGAQLRPIAFTFVVEAVHHAAIQRGEKTSEGRSSCKISATSQWRKLVAGDLVCARRGMGGPRETYLVCEVERPPTTFGCIDELYEANAENGSQRYLPGVESLEHFRAVYAKFGAVTSQATWEGLDFRFLGQGNIVERQGKLFWAPPANTGAGNGEAAGPVVPGRQPEEANELEAADGPGLRCPGQWDESDRMAEDVPDLAAAPAASSAGQHGEPNKRGREEDGASFDVSMRDQEVIGECGEESGSDCQSEGAAAAAPAEILVNVRGRGGDGASHAVSMRDQEAIRRYRPRERKRVPLTKAEMQYLVNRYRERHGEACAKPPDEREIGHIISSGQSNDVKALSMLVDATQVRSFFRCFLDPDRQAVPLELKLGMVVVLTGGGRGGNPWKCPCKKIAIVA